MKLPVQFKPTSAGRHTGFLLVQSETSGSLVVQLSGEALPWTAQTPHLHPRPVPRPPPAWRQLFTMWQNRTGLNHMWTQISSSIFSFLFCPIISSTCEQNSSVWRRGSGETDWSDLIWLQCVGGGVVVTWLLISFLFSFFRLVSRQDWCFHRTWENWYTGLFFWQKADLKKEMDEISF